ncbi:MAG: hypothetical protein M1832_002575 [Thelocarpon impressellum]|nr:MAG: hypothetical protein M1832_002575 [Thelocarpon impressellum]
MTVHGLEELPAQTKDVDCLWLLHPRLQTRACMEPVAAAAIHHCNALSQEGAHSRPLKGIIAVSFDQRNHGSREVTPLANQDWRSGNPTHAQDMFSCYHGTSTDVSLLMDYVSSYAFPRSEHVIVDHLALGISLGGHAAWQLLLLEPRISTAIVVIGCPDYVSLMEHRAAKSRLETWTESEPQGAHFLGSKDFPAGLMLAIDKWDPAGFFRSGTSVEGQDEGEAFVRRLLQGKRVLNLSGGADKLVPYACSEELLRLLRESSEGDSLTDKIYDGVGHEFSPEMSADAMRFIGDAFDSDRERGCSSRGGSKM